MQTPSLAPTDLALVVDSRHVAILLADESGCRPLAAVTTARATDRLRPFVAAHLREGPGTRIFVSVVQGTSREHVVLPVARVLDSLRAEHGVPVVWIPDVTALADLARSGEDPAAPATGA